MAPEGSRVAVRATPPEAKQGTESVYQALVAFPIEQDGESAALWRWCTAPKPVGENNIVSTRCLDATSLVPAGIGLTTTATTRYRTSTNQFSLSASVNDRVGGRNTQLNVNMLATATGTA